MHLQLVEVCQTEWGRPTFLSSTTRPASAPAGGAAPSRPPWSVLEEALSQDATWVCWSEINENTMNKNGFLKLNQTKHTCDYTCWIIIIIKTTPFCCLSAAVQICQTLINPMINCGRMQITSSYHFVDLLLLFICCWLFKYYWYSVRCFLLYFYIVILMGESRI